MKLIGLKYFFGKINNTTDKMFKVFQDIGGRDMVNPIDMSNPSLLESKALQAITSTIENSLSVTVDFVRAMKMHGKTGTDLSAIIEGSEVSEGGKTLKDYCIKDTEPVDAIYDALPKAHWLECVVGHGALEKLKDIKYHIGSINHKWSTKMIKKARDPFSEGAQRISFHGKLMSYAESEDSTPIVLKEFKYFGEGRDGREDYIQNMETQAVAGYMANEFNKVAPKGSKPINFIDVRILILDLKRKYPLLFKIILFNFF